MRWFAEWFDSPYYHILYKNRGVLEAKEFLDRLVNYIHLSKDIKVLDLACGKGRHSLVLNRLGYDVIGLDLSSESISIAKKYENGRLHFYVHDMREIFKTDYFGLIVNLFTSFGYFNDKCDDQKVFTNISKQLKKDGLFVLDYLNADKVISDLIPYEEKIIDGICFKIRKTIVDDFIKKEIYFKDKNKEYYFEEFVRLIKKSDFDILIKNSGLSIINTFGNYNLNEFKKESSDRLILILKK